MAEKFDVVALGELLIDFTENGTSAQGNGLFEACPGGAPCNALAMLRKLGKSVLPAEHHRNLLAEHLLGASGE